MQNRPEAVDCFGIWVSRAAAGTLQVPTVRTADRAVYSVFRRNQGGVHHHPPGLVEPLAFDLLSQHTSSVLQPPCRPVRQHEKPGQETRVDLLAVIDESSEDEVYLTGRPAQVVEPLAGRRQQFGHDVAFLRTPK